MNILFFVVHQRLHRGVFQCVHIKLGGQKTHKLAVVAEEVEQGWTHGAL